MHIQCGFPLGPEPPTLPTVLTQMPASVFGQSE
jgi:hypothetical protein